MAGFSEFVRIIQQKSNFIGVNNVFGAKRVDRNCKFIDPAFRFGRYTGERKNYK